MTVPVLRKAVILSVLLVLGLSGMDRLTAGISVLNIIPANDGQCDGLVEIQASGTAGPFFIELVQGDNILAVREAITGSTVFSGLCAGQYLFNVSNAYGCLTTVQATVEACDLDLTLIQLQNTSLTTASDGAITVEATREDAAFFWSNGQTTPGITGLAPGLYSVTATAQGVCTAEASFTVQSCFEQQPGGGFDPGELTPLFSNFDIRIGGGIADPGEPLIECYVLFRPEGASEYSRGLPAGFTAEWRRTGFLVAQGAETIWISAAEAFENNLAPYVTLTVSNGCTDKTAKKDLIICGEQGNFSNFFIDETATVAPCEGFNDGVVAFEIPNDEGASISVTINSVPLSVNPNQSPVIVSLGGLSPGPVNVQIAIGDCINEFVYQIIPRLPTEIFQSTSGDYCIFEKICDGVSLGTFQTLSEYDFENATSSPCRASRYCNGTVVGSKKFEKRTVHAAEYMDMVSGLSGISYFTESYIGSLLDYAEKFNQCTQVRFCTASMKITSSFTAPFISGYYLNSTPLSPDCTYYQCSLGDPFISCSQLALTLPAELYLNPVAPTIACYFESVNLYKAILAYQAGNFPPEFYDQESSLKTVLEMYENDERAKCATIRFCRNGWEFWSTDIDEIICGEPCTSDLCTTGPVPETCQSDISQDGTGEFVWCKKENGEYSFGPDWIGYNDYHPQPAPEVQNLDDPPLPFKFYTDTIGSEELKNLGSLTNNQLRIPKGVVHSLYNNGQGAYTQFFDYSHTNRIENKYAIPGLELQIEDWDKERLIYIQRLQGDTVASLACQDTLADWMKIIGSDSLITFEHLSETGDGILLGGAFVGRLKYENQLLADSQEPAAFVLKTGYEGNLIDFHVIGNIDFTDWKNLRFSENISGSLLISGLYKNGQLVIDGQNWNLGAQNGIFCLIRDETGQFDLAADIHGGANHKLIDFALSPDLSRIACAFQVLTNSQLHFNNAVTSFGGVYNYTILASLSLSGAGDLQWLQAQKNVPADPRKFDLIYGEDNALFAGFTYSGYFNFLGNNFQHAGLEDIAIVRLNATTGLKTWIKTFKTAENENVSRLFYDSGILYFGGEMEGNSTPRTIGNYQFLNASLTAKKAYISYLPENESQQQNVNKQSSTDLQSIESFPAVKVFPNPFNHTLNVELSAENAGLVFLELTDPFGRVIQRSDNWEAVPGINRFEIRIGAHIPAAVYTLIIRNATDNAVITNSRVAHIADW